MKTLKNLFLNELADMYDAERRLIKAMPKMAKAATCDVLKALSRSHLAETAKHVKTLEQVFQSFDVKARGQTCEATVGLLEEADEVISGFHDTPVINAGLISILQKMEHYEMASYGCLREWAGLLGNKEAAALLQGILDEEKAANNSLIKLARACCNKEALDAAAEKVADPVPDPQPPKARRGIRPAGIRIAGKRLDSISRK